MRSLNEFKAHIQNLGTVKQNRFEVFFYKNSDSWANAPKDLRFRCESLNIPGFQILTTDFKLYGGQPITKIPNGKSFDEVQMTFLTTKDMRDKYWFDEWLDKISDISTNTVSYYNDVASDIDIDIFNEVYDIVTSEFKPTPPAEQEYFGEESELESINRSTIFKKDFTGDIIPIYSIKMIKAIPTRVEAVQVSWADVDQLFKYTVNFSCESLQFLNESNRTKLSFEHLDKTQK